MDTEMIMRNITCNVYYAGVNDRTTDRFENLWPLPYGVSYNAYIVKGKEKIALIDTVEVGFIYEFLKSIRKIIDNSRIDYLVINHMEPDHSGGIPFLLGEFPDMKIIGNKTTISMIKGFYGIESDVFIEISDGDEIDLGDLSLRFILAPMVHWPETMMTYLIEENILFSGDAFGTFGALNGGIIDKNINTDLYIEEMYRYYSNIVGKYGKFVQKALEKTKDLSIEYVCSTHGPIWKDKIKEVIDIYDRLSRYEGEDGVTIIYGSMYGNTTEMAEEIAIRLSERGVKNIKIHDASKSHLSYMISDAFRYKGLIVGAPTYSMHIFPPVEEFFIAIETRELKNRILALFGSFTWASTALGKMNEYVENMHLEILGKYDMKQAPSKEAFQSAREIADNVAKALGY